MVQKFSCEWGGKTLTIEVGKFTNQTNGSCTVQYGDTVVLASTVMSQNKREGIDFFPLMVEFDEKLYAAGLIKGSRFIKREGRPSDESILSGRMIDRAIRPLFDDSIRNEIQVVTTVLSFDNENDADVLGLVAASCALAISDIPWKGPIGGIRIGQINNEWVINRLTKRAKKRFGFSGGRHAGKSNHAGSRRQCVGKTVLEGIAFGQKHLKEVIELINKVQKAVGKEKLFWNRTWTLMKILTPPVKMNYWRWPVNLSKPTWPNISLSKIWLLKPSA